MQRLGIYGAVDATKRGDISSEVGEHGSPGEPNPNSGAMWQYGGIDEDGSVTGEAGEPIFCRTTSTVAVGDGLVFCADISGRFHCVDLATGKRCWMDDQLTAIWGSPLLVDGKVLIGNDDGKLIVYKAERAEAQKLTEFDTAGGAIKSSPTIAQGHLFLADMSTVYCVKVQ